MPSFRKLKRFFKYNSLFHPGQKRLTPSLFIIGAQKSGTTSFYNYFSGHPSILKAIRKEMHFFDYNENFNLGIDWYHKHFPFANSKSKGEIVMDATPNYMFHPHGPARLHDYNPDIKMIIILREPVSRAFSAWNMWYNFQYHRSTKRKADLRSFADAVREELTMIKSGDEYEINPGYIARGMYAQQLERYFKIFPRKNIYIVGNEQLRAEPRKVLDEVCAFAALPKYDWLEELINEKRHVAKYHNTIPEDIKAELTEFYRPHNKRLVELLGKSYY